MNKINKNALKFLLIVIKLFQSNRNNKIIMIQNGFLHTSCVIVGGITASKAVNKTKIRTYSITVINTKKSPNSITIRIWNYLKNVGWFPYLFMIYFIISIRLK